MDIKQGKVVLNGKEMVCTYGDTIDGKQYYFVAGGELPNGIRIATLEVAESLNQTNGVIRTLGLIDKDGTVLVPLENKSVNTIDSTYIVFEKTTPNPDEIIDVNIIKSDPIESAKFAEDTIRIKERMKEVAGENAVDVYANPEGLASVYDLSGKNIVDGNYYSYIIKGKKGFAFATSKSTEVRSVEDKKEVEPIPIPATPEQPVIPVVEIEEKPVVEEIAQPVKIEEKPVVEEMPQPVKIILVHGDYQNRYSATHNHSINAQIAKLAMLGLQVFIVDETFEWQDFIYRLVRMGRKYGTAKDQSVLL